MLGARQDLKQPSLHALLAAGRDAAHRGVTWRAPGLLRLAALGLRPSSFGGLGRAALRVDLRHWRIGVRRIQAHHFLQRQS